MKDDIARGYKRVPNSCTSKISITFDDETFAFLQTKARERNTSFREQALTYIEWGRESEENALQMPEISVPLIRSVTRPERTLPASKKHLRSQSSQLVLARGTRGNGRKPD